MTGMSHGAITEVSSCAEPPFGEVARRNEFS